MHNILYTLLHKLILHVYDDNIMIEGIKTLPIIYMFGRKVFVDAENV